MGRMRDTIRAWAIENGYARPKIHDSDDGVLSSFAMERKGEHETYRMYLDGNGVTRDPRLAMQWLNAAADKNQTAGSGERSRSSTSTAGAKSCRRAGLYWRKLASTTWRSAPSRSQASSSAARRPPPGPTPPPSAATGACMAVPCGSSDLATTP